MRPISVTRDVNGSPHVLTNLRRQTGGRRTRWSVVFPFAWPPTMRCTTSPGAKYGRLQFFQCEWAVQC